MEAPGPAQVVRAVLDAVELTRQRTAAYGGFRPRVAPGWEAFAEHAGLVGDPAADTGEPAVPVAVGPNQHIVRVFADVAGDGVERAGFVSWSVVRPVSRLRRLLRPSATRHLDATAKIWHAGWTPLAVARIDVVIGSDLVELVIGDARPRPELLRGRSYFD
ncbi:MAG: hypothetical protein AAF567_03370 [Actinomycetota bacterium]